jgi:tetratricopeptide (TPR) repeat protein
MISKEIDLMQKRLALLPDSIEVLAKVGAGFYRRSQFRGGHGDLAGATADGQRAVEIYEKIVSKTPNYKNRDNLAFVYSNIAEHLLKSDDSVSRANGIESLRKALTTMREITDKQQDNVEGQRHLAVAASELGKALGGTGHPDEGLPYMEQSLPIFRKLYEADKTNRLARLDLVETEENEGNLLAGLGDSARAVDHCRSAVQLLGTLPNPPESDLELSAALVEAQTDLANAYWVAAEKAAQPKRAGYSRDARLAATEALQTAQHIVAMKPEVAGDYAAFIAKDEELLARQ